MMSQPFKINHMFSILQIVVKTYLSIGERQKCYVKICSNQPKAVLVCGVVDESWTGSFCLMSQSFDTFPSRYCTLQCVDHEPWGLWVCLNRLVLWETTGILSCSHLPLMRHEIKTLSTPQPCTFL